MFVNSELRYVKLHTALVALACEPEIEHLRRFPCFEQ